MGGRSAFELSEMQANVAIGHASLRHPANPNETEILDHVKG
jgi:hypothetical protein